jgi:hypothetical protein
MPGASAEPAPSLPQAPANPPHYHDREKSGQTCTVSRGHQTHDIDLKP